MKSTFNLITILASLLTLFFACNGEDDEMMPCDSNAIGQSGDVLEIYTNSNSQSDNWFPGGWMPDGKGISYQDDSSQTPHSSPDCIKIKVSFEDLAEGWAGIYWLSNDSWTGPGTDVDCELGLDSMQSVKVEFWARGDQGGERVRFLVGGVSNGSDSVDPPKETSWKALSTEWSPYEIDLSGQDLSNLVGGFGWVTAADQNLNQDEISFFLDDIKFIVQ